MCIRDRDWLSDWQTEHGDAWRMQLSRATGQLEMLYGGNAPAPFQLDTSDSELWFELARGWIERTRSVHGVNVSDLYNPSFRYLPLGQMNTNDKIAIVFEQEINGIPVESGRMNLLFDTRGRLLSCLLYTSPSPRDQRGSRMPSSA